MIARKPCCVAFALVLVLGGQLCPGTGRAQQAAGGAPVRARVLAFRNVTVVDVVTGRLRPAQTVLIAGRRIRAVGPTAAVRIPTDGEVVEARGKYLIPGLWDMHVHPWGDADVFYPLFVARGVTGVRDAGSDVPLATLARWKQEIAAGARVGPRLFVAGPSIDECPSPAVRHKICVASPGEARLVVDFLKQAGADFIKPYHLSKELYLAMLAEARRIDVPFGGHVSSVPALEASDSGARFFDHDNGGDCDPDDWGRPAPPPDASQCAAIIQRMRHNGTWLVATPDNIWVAAFQGATIATIRRYYADSIVSAFDRYFKGRAVTFGLDSVMAASRRQPASSADILAVVQRSPAVRERLPNFTAVRGMPVVAGTDAAPHLPLVGYGLHETLATFVLGGMTPLEALQTATLNPAKALHATDSLGTVEVGKVADLVLLDANPLADIWNTTKIRAVVANGRYFDRAGLDELLAQAARARATRARQ